MPLISIHFIQNVYLLLLVNVAYAIPKTAKMPIIINTLTQELINPEIRLPPPINMAGANKINTTQEGTRSINKRRAKKSNIIITKIILLPHTPPGNNNA